MVEAGQRQVLRHDDGGWTEAVGGHVALDLVNTVAWRLDPDRAVDRLTDGASLVRWARLAGVVDDDREAAFLAEIDEDPTTGRRVTAQMRRARERLYDVVHPLATGEEPAADALAVLHRGLLGVVGRARIATPMPLGWTTGLDSVRDLPDELGLQMWRLLEREDPRRLRQCQGADCGWLFLDRTKNASRVWCSSSDCGNRSRARRHYERHHGRRAGERP